jgi:hypothetical protein
MNDWTEMLNFADDAQRWLDRLADGELDADQQRWLLTALETEPDGWRRCALAFVEAQALRGEFRRIIAGDVPASQELASREQAFVVGRRAQQRGFAVHRLGWLAIAASFIVAFTLGVAARGLWPAASLSDQAEKIVAVQPEKAIAAQPEKMVAAAGNSTDATAAASNTPSTKWQALKVTIPAADGQKEQIVEVPLVKTNSQELQSMLAQQKPVLSDTALQTLESTGHEVEQHRAYYPVQLEDGTQAVLPMDFVEVRDTDGWQ